MRNQLRHILLVEDNPTDAEMFQHSLSKADLDISHQIHLAESVPEAVEFLSKSGRWVNAPTPDFVFTDHHLPGGTGLNLIVQIKQHPQWRKIPTFLMSGTIFDPQTLAEEGKAAGADLVFTKENPKDFPHVLRAVLGAAVFPK